MCSLTSPSSAGIQNRLLGGMEGERLPDIDFSLQDVNSDIDSKIMQLELRRARLESQISLSKTQTMLAEMELHLVEIELRHELWRRRSEAQVRPTLAKSQTRKPYRRLLVRKQIRPTARPRYRKPKSCTQDKRHEEVNEQHTDASPPVDDQHHKQVGEFDQTEQGEVVTNDQKSLQEHARDTDTQKRGEKQHDSRFNPDQGVLDAAPAESTPTVLPENVENRIDPQDAALIANARDDNNAKHAGEKEDNQYVSRKEQKSNDSAKTIKKVKRRIYEGKTASSNTSVNKETNTEALSSRSKKSETRSSTDGKLTACSINIERIPIRLRTLSYCISPEINNNDVNTQNSETVVVNGVDTTISQMKEIESTPREKRTLSGTKEANSTNAIEGTNTGAIEKIAQKLRSTCVKVVHKEQSTIKKYSNEKKKSATKNIEGKENVSKESNRSRDSKTKSSNKDKKYESKRYTSSTSNTNRDKEGEKNKNSNRYKSNADKSHDKSRRSTNTGSYRHQKDENGTSKDNAKSKENQPKPQTLIKICYDQSKVDKCYAITSKSSSVERTTVMQNSSGSERAINIDAVKDIVSGNNGNNFLGREPDAFDSKSNILDKATQELQDIGNNLLFEELRNSTVKKERSLSLSSLETLKLYGN